MNRNICDGERTNLLSEHDQKYCLFAEIRVYKRRWWVAFLFCYASVLQSVIWNTFGPIADSVEVVFGWSNSDIGIINNMTNITFMIAVIPISLLMDTRGLKICTITSAFLQFFGCLIRCFTLKQSTFFILACATSGLNGLASIIPVAGPALIAATWFPPGQRVAVTALISFCTYLGSSASFLLGPLLIPDPIWHTAPPINPLSMDVNQESGITAAVIDRSNMTFTNNENKVENMDAMKSGIQNLMYTSAALAAFFLLCTLLYFPAKPPSPPSVSAAVSRTDYRHALANILKNKSHWLVVIAGSLPRGVVATWTNVFDVAAKDIGIPQNDAGWIAICITLIGSFSGLFFTRVSYRLGCSSRTAVILVSVIGSLFSVWASILFTNIVVVNLPSLYVSCTAIGIAIYAPIPLFYEMSAETAFPVGEGVAGGLLMLISHLASVVYLGLLSVPNIGTSWMSWSVTCFVALSVPVMILFKENNSRSELDKEIVIGYRRRGV